MKNLDQSFNKLLEQYLFNMAARIIDKLDRHDQDKLIQFIISIDTAPSPTRSEVDPALVAITRSDPTEKELSKASRKASVRRRIKENEHIIHIRQQISRYQTQIDSTVQYISRVEALIEGTKNARLNANARLVLLNQYQSLHDRYILNLVKTQGLQQKERNRPYRYQAQPA